jgi:formylglycine-generating enzyme required for sulfatase activity
MANQPKVFISSTSEDLREFREAARDAALASGFHPVMMEYFAADGGPPLDVCLAQVTPCDLVLVIVAHRYGWVPPDQPAGAAQSITWLECRHADTQGKEVLALLVDQEHNWPADRKESHRITAAIESGAATPELLAEIQRNVAKLEKFRQWLAARTFATFTTPDDVRAKTVASLYQWRERHPEFGPAGAPPPVDPRPYLTWLRGQTATIDIRGLGVGSGKAHAFPIQQLYIPLTTAADPSGRDPETPEPAERRPVELQETLTHPRLVIVGDPGSGKSTFLRRIVFELAAAALHPPAPGQPAPAFTAAFDRPPLPLFIRIDDLAKHIRNCCQRPGYPGPTAPDSPAWLADYLHSQSNQWTWGLPRDFFTGHLEAGSAILLLDGLDEAPDRPQRESIARLFEQATQTYPDSRFVVTTRPQAYQGAATLSGFHEARIEPLSRDAIDAFLEHWCQGLFPESPQMAASHRQELNAALSLRPEIRRMARNPVMLTALAVVQWNEKRLPEQRADLYDSILTWLARSRENRPGRESADQSLALLQELALAMQNHPEGRHIRLSIGSAAAALAPEFSPKPEQKRVPLAQAFLERETADSGIIVRRGDDLQFWHLTFQEHLAARAIAGRGDTAQHNILFESDKIYRPEWREVVPLLAGSLGGKDRVDGLVSALLDQLAGDAPLSTQARCVGLVGAIVRDLTPLGYQPKDPRYPELLDAVLGIFDRDKAATVAFNIRLEAAEALGEAGDPRLDEDNWVTIPAGDFPMGAQKQDPSAPNYDPEADDDEAPVRKIHLDAYQISRFPVTIFEYRKFVDSYGYQEQRWWSAGGFGERSEPQDWKDQGPHPNRPIVGVNWFEASAYCAWAGGRLPSEAEWERAARGTDGRKYPWVDHEPTAELANYGETGPHHPTPVGMYPQGATPEDLQDVAGNVWEWTSSEFVSYETGKSLEEDLSMVVRGGSWYSLTRFLRVAVRYRFRPAYRDFNFGFRCVRDQSS